MTATITTTGFTELEMSDFERMKVRMLIRRAADLFCRDRDSSLHVHTKAYDHAGGRRKFVVTTRLVVPGIINAASKGVAWTAVTAVREALTDLELQMTRAKEHGEAVRRAARRGRPIAAE